MEPPFGYHRNKRTSDDSREIIIPANVIDFIKTPWFELTESDKLPKIGVVLPNMDSVGCPFEVFKNLDMTRQDPTRLDKTRQDKIKVPTELFKDKT